MVRVTISAKEMIAHGIGPFAVAFYLTFIPAIESFDAQALDSYLGFEPTHNLGYPLFVSLFSAFSAGPGAIMAAQVWLFALGVFMISLAIHRMSTHLTFGILVAATLLLNPMAVLPTMFISSNSFLIILSLFVLGFGLSALNRPTFTSLMGFGIFIGLSVAVEAVAWAYLSLLLIMPLIFAQPGHCTRLKAYLVPVIFATVVIGLHSQIYKSIHDEAQPQRVAAHLFAQASLMDSNQPLPYAEKDPRNVIWFMIEKDLQPLRDDVWSASSFIVHKERFEKAVQHVQANFARAELNEAAFDLDKSIHAIKLDIALARIIHNPAAYFEVIIDQERFIWALDENSPLYVHLLWTVSFLIIFAGIWAMLTRSLTNPLFAASFMCCLILHMLPLTTVFSGHGVQEPLTNLSLFLTSGLIFLLYSVYVTFINPIRTSV